MTTQNTESSDNQVLYTKKLTVETGSLLAGSKAIKSLKLAIHLHRIQRPRINGVYLHITICLHAVVLVTGIILHFYIF
jgi:hypothetical protein